MNKSFDIAVIGLGGIGSATLRAAASTGVKVIGFDLFDPPHTNGSSHGETRLIRKAYFEHEAYVPLLERSYQLWQDIDNQCEDTLWDLGGLVVVGDASRVIMNGIQDSAARHNIPLQKLDRGEISNKYPFINTYDNEIGLQEPGAGFLYIEKCIEQCLKQAEKFGAEIRVKTPIKRISEHPDYCEIEDGQGNIIHAEKILVTAGPWSASLFDQLQIQRHRVPLYWYRIDRDFVEHYRTCFAVDYEKGFFYGFPAMDDVIKLAPHSPGELLDDLENYDRREHEDESKAMAMFIKRYLKGIEPTPVKHTTCIYSMSQDEHFLLGPAGMHNRRIVAGGFSGHGYKFAPVIGEILVDLATKGSSDLPWEFLDWRRIPKDTAGNVES